MKVNPQPRDSTGEDATRLALRPQGAEHLCASIQPRFGFVQPDRPGTRSRVILFRKSTGLASVFPHTNLRFAVRRLNMPRRRTLANPAQDDDES